MLTSFLIFVYSCLYYQWCDICLYGHFGIYGVEAQHPRVSGYYFGHWFISGFHSALCHDVQEGEYSLWAESRICSYILCNKDGRTSQYGSIYNLNTRIMHATIKVRHRMLRRVSTLNISNIDKMFIFATRIHGRNAGYSYFFPL